MSEYHRPSCRQALELMRALFDWDEFPSGEETSGSRPISPIAHAHLGGALPKGMPGYDGLWDMIMKGPKNSFYSEHELEKWIDAVKYIEECAGTLRKALIEGL